MSSKIKDTKKNIYAKILIATILLFMFMGILMQSIAATSITFTENMFLTTPTFFCLNYRS